MGAWNIDASRFWRETLPKDDYHSFSYYEKWLAALTNLFVAKGFVTRDEIAAGGYDGPSKICVMACFAPLRFRLCSRLVPRRHAPPWPNRYFGAVKRFVPDYLMIPRCRCQAIRGCRIMPLIKLARYCSPMAIMYYPTVTPIFSGMPRATLFGGVFKRRSLG